MPRKPKNGVCASQPRRTPAPDNLAVAARLSELEQLIRPPLLPSQLERANALAVAMAQDSPDAVIAMLATRLARAIEEARAAGEGADSRPIALIVARIRAAVDRPV
jgi:hypothetical protein